MELEESKKKLLEISASEQPLNLEQGKILEDQDQTWQPELATGQNQHSSKAAALDSVINEVQLLNIQCQPDACAEIDSLKGSLAESLSLVEGMKNQLKDSKRSEALAQALAGETLQQLETAKKTVESLRHESMKAVQAYNDLASELEHSKGLVTSLEESVTKLEANRDQSTRSSSGEVGCDSINQETGENQMSGEQVQLKKEITSLKSEVGRLRLSLETSEAKYREEHSQNNVHARNVVERAEQIKVKACEREAQLMAEVRELKGNLMDKELELQVISEENEALRVKVEHISGQQEREMEHELRKLREAVLELKANMMDKETELQNIVEENEMLRSELSRRYTEKGHEVNEKVIEELELAKDPEQQADARWTAKAAHQLEAVQTANNEMEAELRRLKVQSEQWRKAAEAAAAVLSAGSNGKFMERTGSMDSSLKPFLGKIQTPYTEDMEEDLKKKQANMLKKIGMLWKKQHN